ncbi:MAG: type IV pilus secretin PilQ [Gammaproteobacteria bacterium]
MQSIDYRMMADHQLRIEIKLSAPLIQSPYHFVLTQPDRIVVDLPDVHHPSQTRQHTVNNTLLRSYLVVEDADRMRLILNLPHNLHYSVTAEETSVIILLSANSDSATTSEYSVTYFDFQISADKTAKMVFGLNDENIVVTSEQQGKRVLLRFLNARPEKALIHRFDVTDFATSADTIDIFPKGNDTEVVITASSASSYFSYQSNRQFIVELAPSRVASLSTEDKVAYSGEQISLNFQDISIRTVLQLLAEFTATDLMVSDAVRGNVTLNLNDIPADQALDIILKTNGLSMRQFGSVIAIAPVVEIAAQEQLVYAAQQQTEAVEPIHSELIQINYAKATEMAALLKNEKNSLLSPRGSVSVDTRTNILWVQDTPTQLQQIRNLIEKIDIPVRQVLIEARIVIVTRDFARDLGIRWGFTQANNLSGTLAGANALHQAGGDPHAVDNLTDRLNVDLPAAPLLGASPASVGLALANLGSNILLDLELSVLESEREAEVISSPRIVTADQQSALIEQGQEIPYQESTASGATAVSFKKAVLSLQVTPHITPDDRILLDLQVNQDQASTSLVVQNTPAIDTQTLQTSVLINNGETIVLGGIYRQTQRHTLKRVPFLSRIPLIGLLFRNTQIQNDRDELLIFIMPSILPDLYSIA